MHDKQEKHCAFAVDRAVWTVEEAAVYKFVVAEEANCAFEKPAAKGENEECKNDIGGKIQINHKQILA